MALPRLLGLIGLLGFVGLFELSKPNVGYRRFEFGSLLPVGVKYRISMPHDVGKMLSATVYWFIGLLGLSGCSGYNSINSRDARNTETL